MITKLNAIFAFIFSAFKRDEACENCGTRFGVDRVHGHYLCGVCERIS